MSNGLLFREQWTDAQCEDMLTNVLDQIAHLSQNLASVSGRLLALNFLELLMS